MIETASSYDQKDSFFGLLASKTHNFAAQVFLSSMTLVITLEVIKRYIFNAGLTWSQEVCGLSFFLLVFLCQANCWQMDRHIRMDIFYNNFGPRMKRLSDCLTICCGTILYGALAWQGMSELSYQFAVAEATVELQWPMWPFSVAMVFGCVLVLALQFRFFVRFISKAPGR